MAFKVKNNNVNEMVQRKGLYFVIPFFILFFVFQLYPILYTFFLSFNKFDGFSEPVFLGLGHYKRILTDKAFLLAFTNTWRMWGVNIVLQLFFAFLFAALLTNIRLRIKCVGFFRAVFFLPNIVTAVSLSLLFGVLLGYPNGAVNQLLYGDETARYINWLGDANRARFIISLIQTWVWFGSTMIILMAGILGVPRTFYEAAEMDGANGVRQFFSITMPVIKPILLFVAVTSIVGGMQLFDIPAILTSGGPGNATKTTVMYIYETGFAFDRFGYASALSYVLFIILALCSFITFRTMNKKN